MGTRVGRSTLFGIPLQQQWSYANSGDFAPTYYLQSDAPLYYYSFTDAYIASVYRALTPAEQARFDPMITGFNPADMYAADHIRRVLLTFPGVFSGIGEFTIHKEFVSAKVSGETASLTNPALDRILDFAAEAGPGGDPAQRHRHAVREAGCRARLPDADEVAAQAASDGGDHLGAHGARPRRAPGAGRRRRRRSAAPNHVEIVEAMLADPSLGHVHFDISWDEVAKVRRLVAAGDRTRRRHAEQVSGPVPVRDRHGRAGERAAAYFGVFEMWAPIWRLLTPEASLKVRKGNYERIFDASARGASAPGNRHTCDEHHSCWKTSDSDATTAGRAGTPACSSLSWPF